MKGEGKRMRGEGTGWRIRKEMRRGNK